MDSQSQAHPVDYRTAPVGPEEVRRRELGALLARARDGDRAALDDIVDRMNELVWNVVRAQGLDRESAADVVQSTWVTFLEEMHSIRAPDSLAAWLITVARRSARRVRDAERRVDPIANEDLAGHAAGSNGVELDIETDVADREQHRRLWANLHKLTPRCQELLRILAFTGRTEYRTVAAALNMPKGSIGPTRSRCVKKLKELLHDDPGWSKE